jgi:hypothetical protein
LRHALTADFRRLFSGSQLFSISGFASVLLNDSIAHGVEHRPRAEIVDCEDGTFSFLEAELANAEKGQQAYEEAVRQLVRFIGWFKERPRDSRRDRHRTPPTMPMPWGRRSIS